MSVTPGPTRLCLRLMGPGKLIGPITCDFVIINTWTFKLHWPTRPKTDLWRGPGRCETSGETGPETTTDPERVDSPRSDRGPPDNRGHPCGHRNVPKQVKTQPREADDHDPTPAHG